MKEKITAFINELILYDYILFGSVFVFFILFVIFGIMLRRRVFFAVIFVLLGFSIFILGPTLGYIKMHEYLFKNTITLLSQKKLTFTQAVVVKGTLTNDTKRDFQSCKITASAYKVGSNELKNIVNKLKPFANMSIIEYEVPANQSIEFKIIIEPFTYEKDYNISIGADCK